MHLFRKFRLDFLVIGAQKAGTSALDIYLRRHKDIGMGNKKEIHFFDNELIFEKFPKKYKAYHKHFKTRGKFKIFGEITPIYIYWRSAIERIYNYNKEIKIIAILRNPVDRAFSQWNMERKKNNETRDFKTCFLEEIDAIENNREYNERVRSYVHRGLYSEQIENVYSYFNSDQVMFIKYESFLKEQKEILEQIFNFLGVDYGDYEFEFAVKNKIEYKSSIDSEHRKFLVDYFKNDINKVESLLQWDCSDWKDLD